MIIMKGGNTIYEKSVNFADTDAFSMNQLNCLEKYILLEETVIEAMTISTPTDLLMTLRVSEWSFTKEFYEIMTIPTDQHEAYSRIVDLFPNCLLKLEFKNVIWLHIDRFTSHARPEMLFIDEPAPSAVNSKDGPWSVFGWAVVKDSELIKKLGTLGSRCSHLSLSAVDMRLDIVFERLQMENFPAQKRT